MKKQIAALALMLSACTSRTYSDTFTEPATVVDLPFVPAGHGSGTGIAFHSDGNISPVVESVDIPARYAVVFQCKHGRFVVQREDDALWRRMRNGEPVTVFYRTIYDDGKAVGLDFLDARERVEQ